MSTMTRKALIAAGVAVAGVVAGCATQGTHLDMQTAYSGPALNFGATPSAAELSKMFSYPPDGRKLPAGSGNWEQGKKVYEQKCQACHGDKLQGVAGLGEALNGGRGTLVNNDPKKGPVKTVESYWPYATSVFDYVKRAMPFNAPGSLTDNEVYAATAYVLGQGNVIGKTEVLNAQTLPKVNMPNKDGFIPGDPRPDVK
ncbi:MAG: cytochrome c [Betaproteobacteria bacterium]